MTAGETEPGAHPSVKLDILSDPICPWCHIGRAHLFRALSRHEGAPFALTWHPFQLNPDMPPEGMDRRAYLEGKFGGRDGAAGPMRPCWRRPRQPGWRSTSRPSRERPTRSTRIA